MGLTQEHYELYTSLTDCVYSELAYPSQIGFNERVVKTSGLRLEIFELIDRKIIIICGTNSLKDWLTNNNYGLPKLLSDEPSNLYYIMMGINETSTVLGTIDDIKTDYHNNPDTFYGNMGRAIDQIKNHAPNSKIIIILPPNTAGSVQTALTNISSHYSITSL